MFALHQTDSSVQLHFLFYLKEQRCYKYTLFPLDVRRCVTSAPAISLPSSVHHTRIKLSKRRQS